MSILQIIVIALDTRLSTLTKLIDLGHDMGCSVHFLTATTPSNLVLGENESFKLSQIEMAIAQSHRDALHLAEKHDGDWTIVLEEDANMLVSGPEIKGFLELLESHFSMKSPLVVHFAPEQFGILFKRRGLPYCKVKMVPDCAVAYALNREAVRAANRQPPNNSEVADWPRALKKLNWVTPTYSMFSHPIVNKDNSSTTLMRDLRLRKQLFHARYLSKSTLKLIKFLIYRFFGRRFGSGYVADERFRTRIFHFF
jgi:hypothetical protein